MIRLAEKSSPCIPPLQVEPVTGERLNDVEALCDALAHNLHSMWQYGEHVLVQREGDSITVAPYRIQWVGSHTPVALFDHERVVGGLHDAKCIDDEVRRGLSLLIRKAEHRRKSAFRECVACGNSKPPECLDGKLCFECFEQSGGVH